MKKKIRLDEFLYERGLSGSLVKAKKEIATGWVKVNGETVRDPGRIVTGEETIRTARPRGEFASRGGYKLNNALEVFDVRVKDKVIADIGASTGGFTDCLLKNGASKVYSIDVGYGVLAYNLRTDPRVIVMERTNIKSLARNDFTDKIDFITIDLSFISVLKIIDTIKRLFSPVSGIVLIKPQFEADAGEHEKGVVREKRHHINILGRVLDSFKKRGIGIKELHFSPIKGPAGNIEFLLYFEISDDNGEIDKETDIDFIKIVEEAHKYNYESNIF